MVPAPRFGTKARNNTFILVIPESLRRPTPEAPGTASSDWPNGIALGWESQWLVRLLILKDDRAGDFSDVFSARTLFAGTNRLLGQGQTLTQHEMLWPFSVAGKRAFPGGCPSCSFLEAQLCLPRALPIPTSRVSWNALVPTKLGTFSEFESPSCLGGFLFNMIPPKHPRLSSSTSQN